MDVRVAQRFARQEGITDHGPRLLSGYDTDCRHYFKCFNQYEDVSVSP